MIGWHFAKRISNASGLVRDLLVSLNGVRREHFAGVIDFSYQHYALGDILTSQVNMACLATEHGCTDIDLYAVITPWAPAAPTQGFITPENYVTYLDNLFPALLCSPMLRSVRLIRDPLTTGLALLPLILGRAPMWPSPSDHLRRRLVYPLTHEIINSFHARHGYVPTLTAPRGYERWAREFIRRHYPGRFLVCINPRQSRLTNMPAVTYRDAPLQEWYAFFDAVEKRHPDVHFFMLGGFSEWEHTLLSHANVSIPRMLGLTLAHELALLHASHLFMGTSSGFATMATFSRIPYLITHIEHVFAAYAGVVVNADRYPFGGEDQYLLWRQEDAGLLLDYFERIYRSRRERPTGSQDPEQQPGRRPPRAGPSWEMETQR